MKTNTEQSESAASLGTDADGSTRSRKHLMDVLTQVLGFSVFIFCLAQRVSIAALFTHPPRTALQ